MVFVFFTIWEIMEDRTVLITAIILAVLAVAWIVVHIIVTHFIKDDNNSIMSAKGHVGKWFTGGRDW